MRKKEKKCNHCFQVVTIKKEIYGDDYEPRNLCEECKTLPHCERCDVFLKKGEIQECKSCEGWQEKLKSECQWCNKKINNNPRHYQRFGNMCLSCSEIINVNVQIKEKLRVLTSSKNIETKKMAFDMLETWKPLMTFIDAKAAFYEKYGETKSRKLMQIIG